MLYDAEFLKKLDEHREKTTYARVISLDLDENPINTKDQQKQQKEK